MKIVCKHCEYEWDYNGRMTLYANCPNCRKAIRLNEEEQDKGSAPFNAKTGGEKK